MSKYLNSKYAMFEAYVPGEQPQDKKYIKLNTNESPYPPSQKAIDAISADAVKDLRLYSDPECNVLREKMAKLYNVEKDNIYLANGSDDILNFSFMAFTENKEAAFPEISYGFYKVFADLYDLECEMIPLKQDFSIDYKDYLNKNKFIAIANPNAPTGKFLSVSEIEEIIKSNKDNVVLIDEAYVDFGGESCYALTKKYNNLLVVGTFSKSRSMAGARLGFAIADKALIDDLNKIKYSTNPYNINRLSLIAGAAAIDDNDYYMQNCKKIIKTRERVTKELTALSFDVIDSKANFVFAMSDKISGKDFYLKLKEKGILVRHFDTDKIKDYNRITIGTDTEMDIFLIKTKEILEAK